MTRPECPTHRGQPRDDCRFCERLIGEREERGLWPDEDRSDRDADAYERWLGEIAP